MSTLTIGSNTFDSQYRYAGTVAKLRVYYSSDIEGSGNESVHGSAVGSNGWYLEVPLTVASHTLSIPGFTLVCTDNSDRPNARVTGVIYDQSGARRETLFDGWMVQNSLAPSCTYSAWRTANRARYVINPPGKLFLERDDVIRLIQELANPLADNTVFGRVRLSVPAVSSSDPIAIGDNDLRVPPTGTFFYASHYDTFADALVSMGNSRVRLIVSEPMTTGSGTVPATVQLEFVSNGMLTISNGATLNILGPVIAPPVKIFANVIAGQGTVSFAGNKSISAYYPQWYPIVGDGVTDDTAALRAFITAVPDGGVIFCSTTLSFLLSSTIAQSARKSISLVSGVDARNDSAFAPQFIWNGTGGVMFDFDICQDIRIEGFRFFVASGKSVDKFINIDGTAGSQISSLCSVKYNTFNAANQSNASAKLVCISESASTNNENMDVSCNSLFVSSGVRGTAAGIGIFNGNNANAKHQRFNDNLISQAAIGIKSVNGSFSCDHLGGGANGISIQVLGATEPITISHLETEGDLQALDLRGLVPYSLKANRYENSQQTNTGGFLKLDGMVTHEECEFYNAPPVGGTLIEPVGSGNFSLIALGNKYATPVTMAQLGYTHFSGSNFAQFTLEQLISVGEQGISDAPSKYYFQYGGFDPANGNVANFFFGNPAQFQGYTLAQLTDFVTPQNGTITYCSNGTPGTNPLTAGGTGCFAVRVNGAWCGLPATFTGTGAAVLATDATLTNPTLSSAQLGTPDSGVLTNCTGLPVGSGVSGLGSGVATFLGTPSSANLAAAVTGETGTGALVFGTEPTINLLVQGEGAVLSISSNTIAPTHSIHHLGSGLLKTIAVPAGFTSGTIWIVPDAAYTYDATGNLVVPSGGGTAVVNKMMSFTWSSSSSKWIPSY